MAENNILMNRIDIRPVDNGFIVTIEGRYRKPDPYPTSSLIKTELLKRELFFPSMSSISNNLESEVMLSERIFEEQKLANGH